MIDSLDKLKQAFKTQGVAKLYVKKLAPNDNSKNQFYLGGNFSVLNIIPHGEIYSDENQIAGSIRTRAKADVPFSWLFESGINEAPNAQLILYPKYPEVRLSGILMGCKNAPSEIVNSRDEGRILFLGITYFKKVIAFAVNKESQIARELEQLEKLSGVGVFLELSLNKNNLNSKQELLQSLTQIYHKQWIISQKLNKDGKSHPYSAQNGGGYTLEAELGISPNGYSEPDYLGWEIKQYGVKDFNKYRAKSPVTLMTPEPTGGIYKDLGIEKFMQLYAYPDKSGKPDRMNFGGVYTTNKGFNPNTGLKLRMSGYDNISGKITDFDGGIVMLDKNENVAAIWYYSKILEHWKRKHAKAAYIPSLFRTPPPEYCFGSQILLCEETDVNYFLQGISNNLIYYDPAIKLENSTSSIPKIKRRSQFRIKHQDLHKVYKHYEVINLTPPTPTHPQSHHLY